MADVVVAGVDVTTLSDADLSALQSAVSTETVRRANLANLPAQATQLAQVFVGAGGAVSTIISAVQGVTAP